MKTFKLVLAVLTVCLWTGAALSQGAQVAFGGLKHDSSLPVEMAADELTINQEEGTAIFSGNVVIGQGQMRLSADHVSVEYATPQGGVTGKISRLVATGDVTMVTGAEAAEADQADYYVETGIIVMTGDVLLTQGANILSANRLDVDLNTGVGVMKGRVRTILQSNN